MATFRKRNNKWHVQIRRKGHPHLTKSFQTKADAQRWANITEADIERGVYIDPSPARLITLNEVLDRYIKEVLPTKRSQATIRSSVKHFKQYLGLFPLASIESSHVAKYRDKRLESVNPQTVVHELSLLSRVLNTAIRDWGIHLPHGNPVQLVRKPKLPPGRVRRLLPNEEINLLSAFQANWTMRSIIIIAIETAMRREEISRLHWENIDLIKRVVYIPETKTDIPRHIPLSERAHEVLTTTPVCWLNGYVFQIQPDSITHAFIRACKRLGINDLRFHDLRHESTSRLFEKGLNPMEVATITGHHDFKMLKRYTHLNPEYLVNKLG